MLNSVLEEIGCPDYYEEGSLGSSWNTLREDYNAELQPIEYTWLARGQHLEQLNIIALAKQLKIDDDA